MFIYEGNFYISNVLFTKKDQCKQNLLTKQILFYQLVKPYFSFFYYGRN